MAVSATCKTLIQCIEERHAWEGHGRTKAAQGLNGGSAKQFMLLGCDFMEREAVNFLVDKFSVITISRLAETCCI